MLLRSSLLKEPQIANLKRPALDPETLDPFISYDKWYPVPFNEPCRGRHWRQLGDAVGLSEFGVNLVTLLPGAWSSQRHWHTNADEFVFILKGEVVLVTDGGEQLLTVGMAAGFPAGQRDGHHLINRSDQSAKFIEIGTRASNDDGDYSDIDMKFVVCEGVERYFHKNGDPY